MVRGPRSLPSCETPASAHPEGAGERRLYIVAGDPSGDLHGANLVRAFRALRQQVSVRALGGPRLESAGVALSGDLTALSVMGVRRIVPLLGTFLRYLNLLRQDLCTLRPHALILIDYPGFNFISARVARRLRIPVVYYCCPQLWAWAPWRVKRIRRVADLLLVIFPFEEAFFSGGPAEVAYVGHPLCDELSRIDQKRTRSEVRAALGLSQDGLVVGLFPGSRTQEIAQLGRFMQELARLLSRKFPQLSFALSCLKAQYRCLVPESSLWRVFEGPGEPLMAAVDFAVVASGTASLELAYFGVPHVVVYPVPRWQRVGFELIRTTPYISTVNLLAGQEVVPECFVGETRRDLKEVLGPVLRLLQDQAYRQKCRRLLEVVAKEALRPGASARAASLIESFCVRGARETGVQ